MRVGCYGFMNNSTIIVIGVAHTFTLADKFCWAALRFVLRCLSLFISLVYSTAMSRYSIACWVKGELLYDAAILTLLVYAQSGDLWHRTGSDGCGCAAGRCGFYR